MRERTCAPNPNLLESMRSVGYDLNTAVADIIDNSIAANATKISILYFGQGEEPYIAIVDNGNGMSEKTAFEAMQLAGNSPNKGSRVKRSGSVWAWSENCFSLASTIFTHDNTSERSTYYTALGFGRCSTRRRMDVRTIERERDLVSAAPKSPRCHARLTRHLYLVAQSRQT